MCAKDITVREVRAVVDPIWSVHIDTAWQVLTRMRAVLDSAAVEEGRNGAPNPAAWRGNLEHVLARPSKVKAKNGGKQHQPAMAWRAMPGFWATLKGEPGTVADCLRWMILTAVRPSEARRADLNSISDSNVWITRTKTLVGFDIPLCAKACAIMDALRPTIPSNANGTRYLFQGQRSRRVSAERRDLGSPAHPPLGDRAMLSLIERLEAEAEARQPGSSADWRDPKSKRRVVVHGMRAAFRTWAVRGAGAPRHLAELALSHRHETDLDNAYDRETEIEARLALYEAWAAFLETGIVKPYRDCVRPDLWQRLTDIGR
jgi:integrase